MSENAKTPDFNPGRINVYGPGIFRELTGLELMELDRAIEYLLAGKKTDEPCASQGDDSGLIETTPGGSPPSPPGPSVYDFVAGLRGEK